MTQKQQIQMLNSIMPEIVESKDPETAMLKCAKKNNLSPAQLEKLGHVFNSMKTLVGLEKQANRGDSFSIVNVPEMVSKYTTYDPAKVLNAQAENVHAKVNKLTKDATADPDGWGECLKIMQGMNKAASVNNDWCFGSKATLPSAAEWMMHTAARTQAGGAVEYNDTAQGNEWLETEPDYTPADIMHKAANARLKLYNSVNKDLQVAEDLLHQTVEDANVVLQEKLASFKTDLLYDRDKWNTCVMDAKDCMTAKNFATAMHVTESYFDKVKFRGLEKSANIDRGFMRKLAKDSTGLVEKLQEIVDLHNVKQQALELLDGFTVKEAAHSVGDAVKGTNDMLKMMQSPTLLQNSIQADYDKHLNENLRDVAIQDLMLTDPIIAEADPATVQDLYATIADLSPTIAKDPIRMAPVLKEALQYDALPMQQIKDLLSIEESSAKIKKLDSDATANKKDK